MITGTGLLLFGGIAIAYSTLKAYQGAKEEHLIFSGIDGLFKGIGISITIYFIVLLIAIFPEQEYLDKAIPVRLYGLAGGSGVQGSAVIGTGSINDVQYVFYNTAVKGGLIKTRKVELEKCYFDNNSPTTYLEIKEYKRKSKIPSLIPDLPGKTLYIFHLRREDMNIRNYYDLRDF